MLLKTILNRIERHKSFVYGKARIVASSAEFVGEFWLGEGSQLVI